MCLLVVCSPNSTPKKKDLECASCNNPHGFGYAVVAGNKIITGRGMSANKVIKEFLKVRKEHPTGYAMFHARFATHGVKNQENCHPFIVGGDTRTYLAHNGILDIEIHATDKRSDTRVFAEDTLPMMGGVSVLDDDNVFKILSKWSSGSKIAILTTDPSALHECYIINESSGHWDNDGMWWSNDTYKDDPFKWSSHSWASDSLYPMYIGAPSKPLYNTVEDEIVEDECPNCLTTVDVNTNPYYCDTCMLCYDCNGTYQDSCLCWSPEADNWVSSQHKLEKGVWKYDKSYDFTR